MTERDAACAAFLDATGYGAAERTPITADASNRRYMRVHGGEETVVLMDAPPEKGEDVRPFIRIDEHLRGAGLSAPAILARDESSGFLLLEDLGDDLYAKVLANGGGEPDEEMRLYSAAIDVLCDLHRVEVPEGVGRYDAPLMTDLAALAFDWYLGGIKAPDPDARAAFETEMHAALKAVEPDQPVLVLRDYHAENLMWLPHREGPARVGLLDFQDAMAGHPAYDLASLLQDARRDVSARIAPAMIARYADNTGADRAELTRACNVMGAQRNLRILGVFARLCLRDGKAHYIDMIPRVWSHLMRDLADPTLAAVASLVTGVLPPPDPDNLQRLKAQCGTAPTL